jgi:hypothetical protein
MRRKYKHKKYTWSRPCGTSIKHKWEIVGPKGGMHLHVSVHDDKQYGNSCGLEFHHITGDGAPDHVNCPLTGGRCWHDGTSLYASEHVWPMVKPMLQSGDHDAIFRCLEHIADEHFDETEAA